MAFMMINIFITIVCAAFKEIRYEIRRNGDELHMFDYFKDKFNKYTADKSDRANVDSDKYLDQISRFPRHVDRLIENLSRVI